LFPGLIATQGDALPWSVKPNKIMVFRWRKKDSGFKWSSSAFGAGPVQKRRFLPSSLRIRANARDGRFVERVGF